MWASEALDRLEHLTVHPNTEVAGQAARFQMEIAEDMLDQGGDFELPAHYAMTLEPYPNSMTEEVESVLTERE